MTAAEASVAAVTESGHTSYACDVLSQRVDSMLHEPQHPMKDALIEATFTLPRCIFPPRRDLEPVETFVAKAVLEQHNSGSLVPLPKYKGLLDGLRSKTDLIMLHRLLLALRIAGGGTTLQLLTSRASIHARLVHWVVRLNPFELVVIPDKEGIAVSLLDIADAQFHLLVAIVSANSVYLVPTLTSLWNMLTEKAGGETTERALRIHAALATIVRLCPTGRIELFTIVKSRTPFRLRPQVDLVWYYKQMMHIIRYIPNLEDAILEIMIEKSLEMDVDIKIKDGGQVSLDQNDENDDDLLFAFDADEPLLDSMPLSTPMSPSITVDEMADKLDSLMTLLFDYIEAQSLEARANLYPTLARVFESSILITHKSKFVQFLLLHVCGSEVPNGVSAQTDDHVYQYRDLCTRLIHVIVDPLRALVTRQTGACYLASFVSRANFVCGETICECVGALLQWAETYLTALGDAHVQAADARQHVALHALFYTICQSAFYIMCFRGGEALDYYRRVNEDVTCNEERELQHIDMDPSRWARLCQHSLQPLKYCLESVRDEFLYISNVCNLLDPFLLEQLKQKASSAPKLQRKKKITQIKTAATLEKERLSGGVGGMGRGANPLHSFFPFDPYLLRRSHRYIEPFYNHWVDVADATIEERNQADDADAALLDDEDDSHSDEADGDDLESVDDSSRSEDGTGASLHPMSYTSNNGSLSSQSMVMGFTPVATKGESFRDVWQPPVNRSRTPSMENGSCGSW